MAQPRKETQYFDATPASFVLPPVRGKVSRSDGWGRKPRLDNDYYTHTSIGASREIP